MKKTLALILACVIVCAFASFLCAAKEPVVYVTIANGELVLAREPITLTDADGDGALTVNDALYLAHEAKFEGGAAAGYASSTGDYGLSLNRLWGVEKGGSYGYFVNDNSAMSMADPVSDGDEVVAYIYTASDWSDAYTFFDIKSGASGAELTFCVCSYDENWALVKTPTAGAEITVDGVKTGVKTDANGKAKVELAENGEHIVSAVLEGKVIVPPVCTLTKKDSTPKTGDAGIVALAICGVIALAGFGLAKRSK